MLPTVDMGDAACLLLLLAATVPLGISLVVIIGRMCLNLLISPKLKSF